MALFNARLSGHHYAGIGRCVAVSSTVARPPSLALNTPAVASRSKLAKKSCSACGVRPLIARRLCVHFCGQCQSGDFCDQLIVCYGCVGASPGALQLRGGATTFRAEVVKNKHVVHLHAAGAAGCSCARPRPRSSAAPACSEPPALASPTRASPSPRDRLGRTGRLDAHRPADQHSRIRNAFPSSSVGMDQCADQASPVNPVVDSDVDTTMDPHFPA
jgi:hypothetical protein